MMLMISCRMALKAESVLLVALLLLSLGNTEPLFLGKMETLSLLSQVVFDLRNLNVFLIYFFLRSLILNS